MKPLATRYIEGGSTSLSHEVETGKGTCRLCEVVAAVPERQAVCRGGLGLLEPHNTYPVALYTCVFVIAE